MLLTRGGQEETATITNLATQSDSPTTSETVKTPNWPEISVNQQTENPPNSHSQPQRKKMPAIKQLEQQISKTKGGRG